MRSPEIMSVEEKLVAGREILGSARDAEQVAEINLSRELSPEEKKVWKRTWYYGARKEVFGIENFIAPAKIEGDLDLTNIDAEVNTLVQALTTGAAHDQPPQEAILFGLRRIMFTKNIQRRLGVKDKAIRR